MSRSRQHFPATGITTARSEKEDKQINHRRHRAKSRQAILRDSELMPDERETSNPWSMSKDGKMLFDPAKYPELMRK